VLNKIRAKTSVRIYLVVFIILVEKLNFKLQKK